MKDESSASEALRALIALLRNKRPRTVADHILAHGAITTEELKTLYGYEHPPRAARDLREAGIPLETFSVRDTQGKRIAAYRFGDLSQIRAGRLAGRKVFSKAFKAELFRQSNGHCAICLSQYDLRYFQIDHRIPYEVAGDMSETPRQLSDYMLLCGECNRAKAWTCEHCPNGIEIHDPTICGQCYWAHPENYTHIAMQPERRLTLVWNDENGGLVDYERIRTEAENAHQLLPEYIKNQLAQK